MESRYCATSGIELVMDWPPLISTRTRLPWSVASSTADVEPGVCPGVGKTQKVLPPIDIVRIERLVESMKTGLYDLPAAAPRVLSAEPRYDRAPRLSSAHCAPPS